MKDIFNNQILKIAEELELIESTEEKIKYRIEFAKVLSDFLFVDNYDSTLNFPSTEEETKVIENNKKTEEEIITSSEVSEDTSAKTKIIVEDTDCTEEYYSLSDDIDEEVRLQIAEFLATNKEAKPIYSELTTECNLTDSLNKAILVEYVKNHGIDIIDQIMDAFTSGAYTTLYEGISDNNIDAFIEYLHSCEEDDEEE